jgi:hypothetical protein
MRGACSVPASLRGRLPGAVQLVPVHLCVSADHGAGLRTAPPAGRSAQKDLVDRRVVRVLRVLERCVSGLLFVSIVVNFFVGRRLQRWRERGTSSRNC